MSQLLKIILNHKSKLETKGRNGFLIWETRLNCPMAGHFRVVVQRIESEIYIKGESKLVRLVLRIVRVDMVCLAMVFSQAFLCASLRLEFRVKVQTVSRIRCYLKHIVKSD
jgi:hypothetical protein